MNKALIVDGNSIINRAYFGIKNMKSSSGFPTGAIFGFFKIIDSYIKKIRPDYIAIAFDTGKKTFRHEFYEDYKKGRRKTDDDLKLQFPVVKEILALRGIKYIEKQGFEADDLIGTLSKSLGDLEIPNFVLSGDKDMFQLVGEYTKVAYHGIKNQSIYDEEMVREDLGVSPEQVVDFKAIMGDSADNIPGVRGIGKVGAAKILNIFHTLDEVYQNIEDSKIKAYKNKLLKDKDLAYMSKELAKIDRDVDIDFKAQEFLRKESQKEDLLTIYNKYNLNEFLDELFSSDEDLERISRERNKSSLEFVFHSESFEYIKDYDFDREVYFEILRDKEPLDKEFEYLAMYQTGKKVLFFKKEDSLNLAIKLKEYLNDKALKIAAYDTRELMLYLYRNEITNIEIFADIRLAAYILEPGKRDYPISSLVYEFFGRELFNKKEIDLNTKDLLKEEDKFIYELMLRRFDEYPDLIVKIKEKLKKEELYELYFDIELALSKKLIEMQLDGFMIDKNVLLELEKDLINYLGDLEKEIHNEAGEEFNILSPKQLGIVLFEKLKLKSHKKTKTSYSTAKEHLEKNINDHEIISKILDYRVYSKLLSTYVLSLAKLSSNTTGKIHSYFDQSVTATGRLSSLRPNLQNIPIRYDYGRKVRKAFVASSDDNILITADYSQIELRILAHLSQDEKLIEAFKNNIDIHTRTASEIFAKDINEINSLERTKAKAVNFGIIYGMGGFSLSEDISVSVREANNYIEKYFRSFPKVKAYLDASIISAKRNGYASSITGRIRKIDELSSVKFMVRKHGERIAMNMPIQGSAADIIKLAMIELSNALIEKNLKSRIILQVHDELILDVPKKEESIVENLLKEKMENVIKLKVPIPVKIQKGNSWYECK